MDLKKRIDWLSSQLEKVQSSASNPITMNEDMALINAILVYLPETLAYAKRKRNEELSKCIDLYSHKSKIMGATVFQKYVEGLPEMNEVSKIYDTLENIMGVVKEVSYNLRMQLSWAKAELERGVRH